MKPRSGCNDVPERPELQLPADAMLKEAARVVSILGGLCVLQALPGLPPLAEVRESKTIYGA